MHGMRWPVATQEAAVWGGSFLEPGTLAQSCRISWDAPLLEELGSIKAQAFESSGRGSNLVFDIKQGPRVTSASQGSKRLGQAVARAEASHAGAQLSRVVFATPRGSKSTQARPPSDLGASQKKKGTLLFEGQKRGTDRTPAPICHFPPLLRC